MSTVVPQPLLKSLEGVPGFDRNAFVQVHQSGEQVTSIRINPSKFSAEQLNAHIFPVRPAGNNTNPAVPVIRTNGEPADRSIIHSVVPWCANGRYLTSRPPFTLDPIFHAGAYYVQEASSMFLDHVVRSLYTNNAPPQRVLDLCAAPGGKSTLLSAALPNSFMVCNEVVKNRVTILAENISKWGSATAVVTHNTPVDFQKLPGFFDLLVVDAPCSGSGLFRKDADAVLEWSEDNVMMCSIRQRKILGDVLPALRQDGYLLYSTCSYSPAENEEICDWLVEEHQLQPVATPCNPEWGIVETFSASNQAPGYRFYPDQLNGEGFFIACFKQLNYTGGYDEAAGKPSPPPRHEVTLIEPWLNHPGDLQLYKQKDTFIAYPKCWSDSFSTVQQKLYVRKSGVALGTVKGKDFIPHHELALSHLLSPSILKIELSYTQALQYLKRQDLHPDTSAKGWALATYNNLQLGWMKLLGNRVNNYYPTEWRILKP